MQVTVVGSGYVGLVAATCFAETGNDVVGVDIDKHKVARLSKGISIIYEPGLDELLTRNIAEKRLRFTTDIKQAIQSAEIIFIAVGTPPGEDGSADLQYVLGVAKQIGQHLNGYKVVVNKSTVPVGTAQKVSETIQSELSLRHVTIDFDVISNPEFLKEGSAIDDFMKPDRIVIGGSSERALSLMKKLYASFLRTDNRIYVMDNKSAEVTKYAANAMLATKISFMNEMAALCDKVGANIDQVRFGIGSDDRIGKKFLFPGIGYGGSCFPKDVKALVRTGRENGLNMKILEAVEDVNDRQKKTLFGRIQRHFENKLAGKAIAVWGLAFKPRTDDMREAPSIEMINLLLEAGVTVKAYDPVANQQAKDIWGDRVILGSEPYQILDGADALLIHTEWNEFRSPNFETMKTHLNAPVIFDGRNLYDPADMHTLGFTYFSLGRPS